MIKTLATWNRRLMDLKDVDGYALQNLSKLNIILGKNGCGKSTLLRAVESAISANQVTYGKAKYITPERGGVLIYEAGIEQSLSNNLNYLSGERRRNQTIQFRQQSVAQYKQLETLILREIEYEKRGDTDYTFDKYVTKINSLLDNIKIKRDRPGATFKIYDKASDSEINAQQISSGESELISLSIECLIFSKECIATKENFLLLDEPDVHLHPDLQVRFMHFLRDLLATNNFRTIIATHSTAILGALETYKDVHLSLLAGKVKELAFNEISGVYRKVLPVFGAHPLSNIFNEAPVLLVEGEDDERIWQQVVRSSKGHFKLYPCPVDGVDKMAEFEDQTRKIIQAVYDKAVAYSLRDRDGGEEEIQDIPPLIRMKLSCRSAENLLLTDEVLASLDINWDELKTKIDQWLSTNESHVHFAIMKQFKEEQYDRKFFDLKDIRNDLMGIIGSAKPWEVVVGKAIAKLQKDKQAGAGNAGSLLGYLGPKVVEKLIPNIQ